MAGGYDARRRNIGEKYRNGKGVFLPYSCLNMPFHRRRPEPVKKSFSRAQPFLKSLNVQRAACREWSVRPPSDFMKIAWEKGLRERRIVQGSYSCVPDTRAGAGEAFRGKTDLLLTM